MSTIRLLDKDGKPLPQAMFGGGGYEGARASRELLTWTPALRSADAELLPDLNMLQARVHDLSRNYALVSGGMQAQLDNVIGAGLKLAAKPDYRVLGIDADTAADWARKTEAQFRQWSEDIDCYCDASRQQPIAGLLGMAYRSFMTTGEIVGTAEWLDRHPFKYRTAIQLINSARLSNPFGASDTDTLRGGVEQTAYGEAVAYHFRNALQSDARFGSDTYTWKRVEKDTPWGRAKVFHIFDPDLPGQSRGKASIVSGIAKAKVLERFQKTALEAAIVNSMYAAVIESDFDYAQAAEALEGNGKATELATGVLASQAEFHSATGGVRLDGVKIPHLYPGESLKFTSSNHPGPNFAEFEKATLRHLASALGISYEQLARDYSDTNYSGARAGMIEAWKFFTQRRFKIAGRLMTIWYALWLEEAIDRGDVVLPAGAPDFYTAKTAWTRCAWIGPGKGSIDPLKESKSDQIELEMGTLTLEMACAERGYDWEEVLEQRAREQKAIARLGVVLTNVSASASSDALAVSVTQ